MVLDWPARGQVPTGSYEKAGQEMPHGGAWSLVRQVGADAFESVQAGRWDIGRYQAIEEFSRCS